MAAVSRGALALFFIFAGIGHLVSPAPYLAIMPSYLLWPRRHRGIERRRGNPRRPRRLLSRHPPRRRLVADCLTDRRLPRQHSRHLHRHEHRRTCLAGLDALGATPVPTALHRLGLPRLFEEAEFAVRL